MGWWELNITDKKPTQEDLEHIARLITEGFTSGDLND